MVNMRTFFLKYEFTLSDVNNILKKYITSITFSDIYIYIYLYTLLNDLYSSPNSVRVIKLRRMRWAGHVASMGEERGVCRVLVGKPEGRSPLGRPRRRWVDNIRMDLQEVGCG